MEDEYGETPGCLQDNNSPLRVLLGFILLIPNPHSLTPLFLEIFKRFVLVKQIRNDVDEGTALADAEIGETL